MARHGTWDTAPQRRVLDPRPTKDLRHLRDVAEHVGEVPHRHRATERGGSLDPEAEIADDGLARAEELVEEDEPRPEGKPTRLNESSHAVLVLRPHLQVVLDSRSLTVEREAELGIRLRRLDQSIELDDEAVAKDLKGLVPLTIPVRVRHEDGASRFKRKQRCDFVRHLPGHDGL